MGGRNVLGLFFIVLLVPVLVKACASFAMIGTAERAQANLERWGDSIEAESERMQQAYEAEQRAEVEAYAAERLPLVREALQQLVQRQNDFMRQNGRYAASVEELGYQAASRAVSVRIVATDNFGWVARGQHYELSGQECVIYGGVPSAAAATDRGTKAGGSGMVACDP